MNASLQSAHHATRGPAAGRAELRILLVDDEPELLRVLQLGLRRHLTVAVDGAPAAMRALAGGRFDVVISDQDMGEVSGLVLLAHVAGAHPHVRRILFCGSAPPALGDLRATGIIEHFVAKPGFAAIVALCDELARTETAA